MIEAKVICDSLSPKGSRLITVEVQLHRFILPEFNTHRMISKNFQSSRAVPVSKIIEQVKNNPAMPVHWGKNQRGMVAEGELTGAELDNSKELWRLAASSAACIAESLEATGAHKQVANRILEPFMWTKGVATATLESWEAMFKLRCHKDAQPEFQALAYKVREVIECSVPVQLNYNEWHLPYVKWARNVDGYQVFFNEGESKQRLAKTDAIKVSASCCAQVSYRSLDDSLEKAGMIYEMLNLPKEGTWPDDPPHFSPTEHIAMAIPGGMAKDYNGNFHNTEFAQYRKILESGKEALIA